MKSALRMQGVGRHFGRTEVLRMAIAMGYYSDPRQCTLDDLASSMGVSKAAVHKRLQMAENALIRSRFDGA